MRYKLKAILCKLKLFLIRLVKAYFYIRDFLIVQNAKHKLVIKKETDTNLKLPCWLCGAEISWTSDHSAICDNGKLIYNKSGNGTIIACLSKGAAFTKKKFSVYVLSMNKTSQNNSITFETIKGANVGRDAIMSSLYLPQYNLYGYRIIWSSLYGYVNHDGSIIRGRKDQKEILTAECGGEVVTFQLTLKAYSGDSEGCLIFVPHGDDELFFCGSIIRDKVLKNVPVYVCFTTNTDSAERGGELYALERHLQSYHSLAYLGVAKENIFMLGYSNRWKGTHIYNCEDNEICESSIGRKKTYATSCFTDYHTISTGRAAQYTKENILVDIKTLIKNLLPSEIYCLDLDAHIDHRALSLLFDRAMGEILLEDKGYKPRVYKGFAYCTGCYSRDVFSKYSPVPLTPRPYHIPNPYYCWDDRISILTCKEFLESNLNKNTGIQALLYYKRMYEAGFKFIHYDCVFWERRTDNLLREAEVITTSGEAKFLNDFMLLDTDNIQPYHFIKFEKRIWKPDENDTIPRIQINLKRPSRIYVIKIYEALKGIGSIKKVRIMINNNERDFNILRNEKPYIKLILSGELTDVVLISLLKTSSGFCGISEIEVFDHLEKSDKSFYNVVELNRRKIKHCIYPIEEFMVD